MEKTITEHTLTQTRPNTHTHTHTRTRTHTTFNIQFSQAGGGTRPTYCMPRFFFFILAQFLSFFDVASFGFVQMSGWVGAWEVGLSWKVFFCGLVMV